MRPRRAGAVLLVLVTALFLHPISDVSAGVVTPHPGFGSSGFVTFDFGGTDDWAQALALQPDGKILVGGWAYTDHQVGVVSRLNPDGSLDRTFAAGGIFRFDPGGVVALLVQPDGRIVVAGWRMIRLTPNGRLDPTFGDDGVVAGDMNFSPVDAVLDSAGRVVVAGDAGGNPETQSDVYLARYTPAGVLDDTFGDGGRTVVDTGSTPGDPHIDNAYDLVTLDDGAYAVVGRTAQATDHLPTLVVRFTASGALDRGFDGDGYKLFRLGNHSAPYNGEAARSALMDSAGRVIVGVDIYYGGFRLIRLLPSGEVDASFGTGVDEHGGLLARDTEGRIIAASGNSVSRFTATGHPDRSFNYATTTETPATYRSDIFGGRYAHTQDVAVAPDGSIVVAGFGVPSLDKKTAWGHPDNDWFVQSLDPVVAGYWMLSEDGKIYNFGDAAHYGDTTGLLPRGARARTLAAAPDSHGYWIVTDRGTVFSFGSAVYRGGSPQLTSGETVTSISPTPTGGGYWLFTDRGRAFGYGDAAFRGDMAGVPLNGGVLGSVSTPSGNGYYMIASDGGVFSFGDARFAGSMGGRTLNAPVQGLVPDQDGEGYWLVAGDGGIFAFGATFRGSMGAARLNRPVIGMVGYGNGYLMVASDGGIFNFSDRPFVGSLGANPPAAPIVAVAVVAPDN